ncbi:MAG: UDP-N-acetylmuramate--L-alanine ligase [Actinobacteria bacterium]|nr:UDP-N-acetylmuramate--L-alanine ligase [Actinomycetota bacterium]
MSGIARILLQRGHRVSGSDLQEGRALDELRAMGAEVRIGHDAAAVEGAEAVVISTAVSRDNPEIVAAERAGTPVLRRAEMLAALMEGSRAVLIAGTHGKTTTTSMAVVALQAAGADPSFAIGGSLNESGTNAHAGADDVFVSEADESDRSFLAYRPDLAVVTNLELDHPDEFTSDEDVAGAFVDFLRRRTPGAPAIVCLDDPGSAALTAGTDGVITYGTDPRSDVRLLVDDDGAARLRADGEDLVSFRLGVPGHHNLLNATAALTVARWVGVDLELAATGLTAFTGALRRYQRLGGAGGVAVIDDYAHHPTELRTTLAAARSEAEGRVVLVVQPHRYSRTKVFGAELGRAAAAADVVVVTEIYASSEEPVPGVSGRLVADAAEQAGAKVVWEPHLGSVPAELARIVQPGDLVLVTGAGDVTQVGPALLELLRTER